MGAFSFIAGNIIYSAFDEGIADILGLQTLRHGTNVTNAAQIRINGGDPNHGGKDSGSTKDWVEDDTRNYFYVFKDDEWEVNVRTGDDLTDKVIKILMPKEVGARIMPHFHAGLSGYNFTAQIFPKNMIESSVAFKYFACFISAIGGLFSATLSPTLRFRFAEIDHSRFKDDPLYAGAAYKTSQKIEAWRIGIFGSLATGVNSGWFERAKANPIRILIGVAKLVCAVALTVLCIKVLVDNPWLVLPALAGAILA